MGGEGSHSGVFLNLISAGKAGFSFPSTLAGVIQGWAGCFDSDLSCQLEPSPGSLLGYP